MLMSNGGGPIIPGPISNCFRLYYRRSAVMTWESRTAEQNELCVCDGNGNEIRDR